MNGPRQIGFVALELAALVALQLADLHRLVPLSKTPFLFALAWISLRRRGLRWRDVGFARPPSWRRAILVGAAAGIATETLSVLVTQPAFARLAGVEPDLSDFQPLVGRFGLLLVLLVPSWVPGALGEEMVWRGWLLSRLAGLGRSSAVAWAGSLLAASALFGWAHVDQGPAGMLQAGLDGLFLGSLWLAVGRNLVAPVVAHGVANTLAFTLICLGRYPGL